MSRPPTIDQAEERGLLAAEGQDVHTFSNGDDWYCWADHNCHACRWYHPNAMGKLCAFEGAAFMHMVSPELAALFGWTQRTTEHGPRQCWRKPESCRFFSDKKDDNGDDKPPPPPPHDPAQLVMFADPTEDAAIFATVPDADAIEMLRGGKQ